MSVQFRYPTNVLLMFVGEFIAVLWFCNYKPLFEALLKFTIFLSICSSIINAHLLDFCFTRQCCPVKPGCFFAIFTAPVRCILILPSRSWNPCVVKGYLWFEQPWEVKHLRNKIRRLCIDNLIKDVIFRIACFGNNFTVDIWKKCTHRIFHSIIIAVIANSYWADVHKLITNNYNS